MPIKVMAVRESPPSLLPSPPLSVRYDYFSPPPLPFSLSFLSTHIPPLETIQPDHFIVHTMQTVTMVISRQSKLSTFDATACNKIDPRGTVPRVPLYTLSRPRLSFTRPAGVTRRTNKDSNETKREECDARCTYRIPTPPLPFPVRNEEDPLLFKWQRERNPKA